MDDNDPSDNGIDADNTLDCLAPQRVLDLYLEERETDLADSTRRSHRYTIETFVEYCANNDITVLSDVDGRDLHDYRIERRDDVSGNTLRSQLGTVRVFMRFAESIEAARRGIAERIRLPEVEKQSRETRVTESVAKEALDHLSCFKYAGRDHAVFRLLWTTAIRVGTARSFDVEDFDEEQQLLAVQHRPDSATPLKNAERAERLLVLDDDTTDVVADYVAHNRVDVTDDDGRQPLFTTDHGRIGISTLRRAIYRWTRPCEHGEGCPHDRDLEECTARQRVQKAAECPSTRSPHDVRRGAISYYLDADTPVKAISDRADVSESVLTKHYDARTEEEKADARRKFFD
jgi:site-specific recombinase XerD